MHPHTDRGSRSGLSHFEGGMGSRVGIQVPSLGCRRSGGPGGLLDRFLRASHGNGDIGGFPLGRYVNFRAPDNNQEIAGSTPALTTR